MNRIGAFLMLVGTLGLSPSFAADIIPAPEPPAQPPQPPPEQSRGEATPSPRDPGMVKQPETLPHPDSVVNPPVVDPKMAINPEAASPQPVEPQKRQGEVEPHSTP